MNAAALALVEREPDETQASIITIVEENPGIVILDAKKRGAFFLKLEMDVKATPTDMDVKKNRDTRQALATKINRSKKPIDEARLKINKEINATAKQCIADLEALEADVNKVLDAWKAEEKLWAEYATVKPEWPSSLVLGRLETAKEEKCRPSLQAAKETAINTLSAAYIRVLEAEENAAKAAELDRLKAQQEEAGRKAKAFEDEIAKELDAKGAARPQQPSDFAAVRESVTAAQTPATAPAQNATEALRAKLTEMKVDIMRAGTVGDFQIPEASARLIVLAIKAGKVRHVSVNF